MDSEQKNYELAYLLAPSLGNGEVLMSEQKLAGLIEQVGGVVRRKEPGKKRNLAYPIKKKTQGYFGWTTFRIGSNALADLQKKIKGENLLRSMITEEEEETRPLFQLHAPRRALPGIGPRPRDPREREPAKPEERLDLEALDKKLEEILGK